MKPLILVGTTLELRTLANVLHRTLSVNDLGQYLDLNDGLLAAVGIGPDRAKALTTAWIDRLRPKTLVHLGTAGSLRDDLITGTWVFVTHANQFELQSTATVARGISVQTVAKPVTDEDTRRELSLHADAVDMELAAIAAAAAQSALQLSAYKLITDHADRRAIQSYRRVVKTAFHHGLTMVAISGATT